MNRPSKSPHATAVEALIGKLSDEVRLLSQVEQVVSDLRAAIRRNEIDSLEQRVAQHQQLLTSIAQRATDRVQTLQELAVRFDLKSDEVTVRTLSEAVGGELGQRLNAVADELQTRGREVARVNRLNAAMIVQSADLTREVIQVLTNSDPGGNSYDAGGSRQDAVGRSMVELNG